MTPAEVTKLLYNNDGYAAELLKVATNHAIDPYLLEKVLINRRLPIQKFKQAITKEYRFLEVEKQGDTIVLTGIANEKFHKSFINDMIIAECRQVIKYLDAANASYIMNDQVVTLFDIMSAFESFKPPKLDRFKGLGEMDPDMLGLSTLKPDGDRTLIQYSVQDIDRELNEMRYINSNKDLLLKD